MTTPNGHRTPAAHRLMVGGAGGAKTVILGEVGRGRCPAALEALLADARPDNWQTSQAAQLDPLRVTPTWTIRGERDSCPWELISAPGRPGVFLVQPSDGDGKFNTMIPVGVQRSAFASEETR